MSIKLRKTQHWLSLAAVALLAAPVALAQQASDRRLDTPNQTFVLTAALDEISGLSASKDGTSLWAIHDEKGVLYRLAIKDGTILQEIPFGAVGDYEGIEEVDGHIYVVRSDGMLFKVEPKTGKTAELNFSGQIGAKCNIEGLGYEPKKNRLLLACKGATSSSKKSAKKAFEVYAVDLQTQKMASAPAFVINAQAIDDQLGSRQKNADVKDSKGKGQGKSKGFSPSGIAVHPHTDEIHVVSSTARVVVVLDSSGALMRVDALDPAHYAQPEGISFGSDGTLFLSSEARGKRPLLHTYRFVDATKG